MLQLSLPLNLAGTAVGQQCVHFFYRRSTEISRYGVLQHRGRRCEIQRSLERWKCQHAVDQSRIKRIASTNALNDVRYFVAMAFQKLLPVIQTRRPRVI